jgi:nuclear transport factor 2 (NTF2) superfamily protein
MGKNLAAVRFAYEWHDGSDHQYRSYGNENWEFNSEGLIATRFASINDLSGDDAQDWFQAERELTK